MISISFLRTKSSNRSISLGATEPRISNVNDIYRKQKKKKKKSILEGTKHQMPDIVILDSIPSNLTQG